MVHLRVSHVDRNSYVPTVAQRTCLRDRVLVLCCGLCRCPVVSRTRARLRILSYSPRTTAVYCTRRSARALNAQRRVGRSVRRGLVLVVELEARAELLPSRFQGQLPTTVLKLRPSAV
jgi:hypothetical protein